MHLIPEIVALIRATLTGVDPRRGLINAQSPLGNPTQDVGAEGRYACESGPIMLTLSFVD
jgi:hypothetical protein